LERRNYCFVGLGDDIGGKEDDEQNYVRLSQQHSTTTTTSLRRSFTHTHTLAHYYTIWDERKASAKKRESRDGLLVAD
jgi:hypothetical protein